MSVIRSFIFFNIKYEYNITLSNSCQLTIETYVTIVTIYLKHILFQVWND